MCGIAGGVNVAPDVARAGIVAIRHRGPDACDVQQRGSTVLAHARLSIVDVGERSNQPFAYDNVLLTYNGELWNAPQLRSRLQTLGCTFRTTGDTEVVAAALKCWGIDGLERLDGMFAFAWNDGVATYVARDRFGEVPLHWSPRARAFASEVKAMQAMGIRDAQWFPPGHFARLDTVEMPVAMPWYDAPCRPLACGIDIAAEELRMAVAHGCAARAVAADVPTCTLLSGGLDSSAVASELVRHIPKLVAYTAVMNERARDLRCAREVAERLGIELREVRVAAPTADDLGRVIRMIEQPHKAQVEIGWACLALARRMQSDGFRVTYSGEGSDELWASYGFAFHGVQKHGWHRYRKDLFVAQHRKNFARCNKIFLAHGVECRLPFLELQVVELALRLPQDAVGTKSSPKEVLARAYAGELPDEVLRRPKVAFQDGMGMKEAAARAVADPQRFYRAEFANAYGGAEI